MRTSRKLLVIGLVALALGVAGGAIWYLQSESFQQSVQAALVRSVQENTGLICTMDRFHLEIFGGRFAIGGFRVRSSGTSGPLSLSVEQVEGSFRIISLLKPKIRLETLSLDRPAMVLVTAERQGAWNPEGLLQNVRASLALEAGHVAVRNGSIAVNNKRIPFDVSVDNFICDLRYTGQPPGYAIQIAYKNGLLNWAGRNLAYGIDARLDFSLEGLDFKRLTLTYGNGLLNCDGWMRDWKAPVILLHSRGTVAAQDLKFLHPYLSEARGAIQLLANFRWDSKGFYTLGKFSVPTGEYRATEMRELEGVFEVKEEVLYLQEVTGTVGRGGFGANGVFGLGKTFGAPHRLDLSAKNITLKDAARILKVPEFAFENTVDATVRLTWEKGIRDLQVSGNAVLHGMPEAPSKTGKATPLEGDVEFAYGMGTFSVPSARLHSSLTRIDVSGASNGAFRAHVVTSRPAEVLDAVRSFSAQVQEWVDEAPDLTTASGIYEIDGSLSFGGTSGMAYDGSIGITKGSFRSYAIDTVSANAVWSDSHLELMSLKARRGGESASGKLALQFHQGVESAPDFRFEGDLNRISLTSLTDLGIVPAGKIAGTLSARGAVSRIRGEWSGEGQLQIDNGNYSGGEFDSLKVRAAVNRKLLSIIDAQWSRDTAHVQVSGQVRLDNSQMNLTGRLARLSLNDIPAIRKRKLAVEGQLTASGVLSGTPEHPAFSGNFRLDGLRYESWDLGRGQGTVETKEKVVRGNARVQGELGSFSVDALISTEAGYPGKAELKFQDWNIQRIISDKTPPFLSELSTALEGSVELQGQFAQPSSLNFRGELDGARFRVRDYELRNSGKILFAGSPSRLQLERADIRGEGTSLLLSGSIPLDATPTLDLNLVGDLNLEFLQHLEKKIRISGSSLLNVRAAGSLRDPQVNGRATLKGGRFDAGDMPFHFSSMEGNVIFSRNLVSFDNVKGSLGAGSLQITGFLEHQAGGLKSISMQILAHGARFPYPKGFRSVVNAELFLRGNSETQVLAGEIEVVRAEYLRNFSLLEQLMGRSTTTPGPLTADPLILGLGLDLSIHSDGGLLIENELAKAKASLRLTLGGNAAFPSLTGRVEATEGTIFFRGNHFDIVHASADFMSKDTINPILDVRADADVKTYRLRLEVGGALNNLNVNVSSDPPMSTADILSLLTTGKTFRGQSESSRYQSQVTGLSAASILSESLTGVIEKRLERLFGFQTFRVDPFLAGATNDPTARVTISERLSKDLTLTFSRNISTNEEQIILLEYEVNRTLTVVASRDEDGQFGLDFRFRHRFR